MTERVKVVTLGCEKNLVDSEIMSGLIEGRGYSLVEDEEEASVIIVNTCGFIDMAKEEAKEILKGKGLLFENLEQKTNSRLSFWDLLRRLFLKNNQQKI